MQTQSERQVSQVSLCSALAQLMSGAILNPFDVVKTRQQQGIITNGCTIHVNPIIKHSNQLKLGLLKKECICVPQFFNEIIIKEGILSLWRGVSFNLIQSALSGSINFSVYEKCKYKLKSYFSNDMLIASISTITARLTSNTILFPIELLKVKSQAKLMKGYSFKKTAFLQTYQATLKRDIMFNLIFWPVLERTRNLINEFNNNKTLNHMVCSAFAGGLAGLISTPFDVIKTRKQLIPKEYKNLGNFKSLQKIYNLEGIKGLFNGYKPRCIKTTFGCSITITLYEHFMSLLSTNNF